jgi:hypothetical protein
VFSVASLTQCNNRERAQPSTGVPRLDPRTSSARQQTKGDKLPAEGWILATVIALRYGGALTVKFPVNLKENLGLAGKILGTAGE